ncbi:hypothetical protein J6590_056902 [Homalodisca vitripennis]|nr:hypothetical protein J6590_056902 [Homalodisca vitripennis]
MAKQILRNTRGKLLVDLATKINSVYQDVRVEEFTRLSLSPASLPTNLISSVFTNQNIDAEEDKRHDLERNAAQSQEEFVLVPSGQENVFILKPIANSSPLVEDFDQDTTWGDENGFLPTEKNITDVSFDLEQIISEGIVEEGNLDKQTENTIQEIPDERHVQTENATTLEAEVHTKNTKNTTIQEILDENYVQTDNTPSQEIADDNYEPTDLEEVDSNAEKEHEMRGNENNQRKRKRNKKPMKQLWESEQNKAKRMKGEEYFGRRNNDSNKNVFDVRRPKRKLKQRCQCEAKPNSQFKCYKF